MGGMVSVGDLWSSLLESPRQHLLKVLLSISFNCLPWSILMLEKKESLILLERGLQGVPRAIPAYFDLVFQRARITLEIRMDKLKSNLNTIEKHLSSVQYLHKYLCQKKVLDLTWKGSSGGTKSSSFLFWPCFPKSSDWSSALSVTLLIPLVTVIFLSKSGRLKDSFHKCLCFWGFRFLNSW